jgi:hypothetical protein
VSWSNFEQAPARFPISSSFWDHLSLAAFSWSNSGVGEASLDSFFKSFLGGCCGFEINDFMANL